MGARSNIVVRFSNGARIYLYTHWNGRDVPRVVHEALRLTTGEGGRWKDEGVVCRALATRLWRGEEDELLGFSLSPYGTFPDFDEYHVDLAQQVVRRVSALTEDVVGEWSFDDFAARDPRLVAREA
ncbi:MAG TPA: hypothetical protein VFH78_11390 [Candidatus Thermoplasmatota archaeon]|nr:hypothetical protein [Candidatus Thermoplasmatota archaeon]